jgi:hypothetical protein
LENQVYGCAPSNIIYNIVKNYVYSGFPDINTCNLLELDLTEVAKTARSNRYWQKGLEKK